MPSLLEALEKKYYADCQFDNDNNSRSSGVGVGNSETNGAGGSVGGHHGCNSYDIAMDDDMCASHIRQISVFIPRISPLKLVPELLVFNDCDIDSAGDFETIKERCQRVRELDLAQNKLSDWKEVFHILQHMPRIEFLNLSKNQLMGPISDIFSPPASISNLRSIVLNGTYLDWQCVDVLLEQLPILEELHLSLNDYREVLLDATTATTTTNSEKMNENANDEKTTENINDYACSDTTSDTSSDIEANSPRSQTKCLKRISPHKALKTLHFTGNPIENWAEVCRLGRVFPFLQNLVLAQCPIKTLQETIDEKSAAETAAPATHDDSSSQKTTEASSDCQYRYFENLRFLNLSCANINTWDDIDRIARFPNLYHVRVKNWPLWDRLECTEHERRQLLIARLPNVSLLNGGGVITADEREDAERAFIRHYMDKPHWERPKRYDELVAKHGKLDPLVDINLKPDKRVRILLTYNENTQARLVDIYCTVSDLKGRLEKIVGLPPNKMRLYYVDQDYKEFGAPELMKYPNKLLYSYNIQPGDEIIIDEKK